MSRTELDTGPMTQPLASGGLPPTASPRWSTVVRLPLDLEPLTTVSEPDAGPFDPQRSYLLGQFRVFYGELTRFRRAAHRDPASLATAAEGASALDGGGPYNIRDVARQTSNGLQRVLEQLTLDAAARGGEAGAGRFREALYAMAALADEFFLTTDWPGREAWLDTMIERALFGTQLAGEEIFRRIDLLLLSRTAAAVELATVYYMILGLGFEGQYRGLDGSVLGGYRLRLYRFLYRRDAGPITTLVPEASAHTVRGAQLARLPLVHRWAMILTVALTSYLVASEIIWRQATVEVRDTTREIFGVVDSLKARAP